MSIGVIDVFSNAEPHEISCVLAVLQCGHNIGSIQIKTIVNFSPGTGKHLIDNALYTLKCGERWGKGMGPLFLSIDQETSCPERHKYDRRTEVRHRVSGRLFPQGHDAKSCSPP
jgi:hypothetical protein